MEYLKELGLYENDLLTFIEAYTCPLHLFYTNLPGYGMA